MMEKFEKREEIKKGLIFRLKLFFRAICPQWLRSSVADGEFFKNKIVVWMIGLNLFFNLINWIMLVYFIKPVDSSIILHYNVYFGVDLIGNYRMAYILPGIGLGIFFVNFLMAYYFFKKSERIASHVLLVAGFMAQLSLLIASTSVVMINY